MNVRVHGLPVRRTGANIFPGTEKQRQFRTDTQQALLVRTGPTKAMQSIQNKINNLIQFVVVYLE